MTPREKSAPPAVAKPLRGGAAANDNDPLAVTLTVSQLRALVREEAGGRGGPEPLLDKQSLARQLGCSAAHIDGLRKQGLPTVLVGQAVRFDRGAVLAWLTRGGEERETP